MAFANHRGGYLLLGVNDAGEIIGLSRRDNEERLMNRCADLVSPPLEISYYEAIVGKNRVAVIEIETGHNKPYAIQETGKIGNRKKRIQTYYQRYGSTTREIKTRDELQRLFQASGNIHYEIIPVAGAKLTDLNLAAFAEFMQNYRQIDYAKLDEPSLHRYLLLGNISGKSVDFIFTCSLNDKCLLSRVGKLCWRATCSETDDALYAMSKSGLPQGGLFLALR